MGYGPAKMGTLRIVDGDNRHTVPLAASTLVGRAWACLARIRQAGVPLYWLELRWYAGSWAWRPLSAGARTRGSGPSLGSEWRAFTAAGGRPARVTLSSEVWVELVDPAPPEAFVTDAVSGAPLSAEEAEEYVELRRDAVLPVEAEGDLSRGLVDGGVWVVGGRALRAHVPAAEADTWDRCLDLGHPEVELDIDAAARTARFRLGDAEAVARGACVCLLQVYVAARATDSPAGGWLTPDEALAAWVELGAPADSRPDRVAWERAKLRAQLSRAGVAGLDALYEVRREGDTVRTRVRSFT